MGASADFSSSSCSITHECESVIEQVRTANLSLV
jgi:hypothetical protein